MKDNTFGRKLVSILIVKSPRKYSLFRLCLEVAYNKIRCIINELAIGNDFSIATSLMLHPPDTKID